MLIIFTSNGLTFILKNVDSIILINIISLSSKSESERINFNIILVINNCCSSHSIFFNTLVNCSNKSPSF